MGAQANVHGVVRARGGVHCSGLGCAAMRAARARGSARAARTWNLSTGRERSCCDRVDNLLHRVIGVLGVHRLDHPVRCRVLQHDAEAALVAALAHRRRLALRRDGRARLAVLADEPGLLARSRGRRHVLGVLDEREPLRQRPRFEGVGAELARPPRPGRAAVQQLLPAARVRELFGRLLLSSSSVVARRRRRSRTFVGEPVGREARAATLRRGRRRRRRGRRARWS